MRLRPLRWWDIEPLLGLERELFGEESWSAPAFWSELAQRETRFYLVAEDGAELAGYAGLAAWGDEGYVQTVGVRRSRWGRGLGTALVTALLNEAARRRVDRLLLEVRADNPRAQELYRRFGFEPIGLRRGYYQPSGTDAVVMLLRGVRRKVATGG